MGRKKMTDQERLQKDLDLLAKLTGKTLESVPVLGSSLETSREAEAVAYVYERPDKFRKAKCKVCDRDFLVNYPSVAMCSDTCRKEHLRRMGILWSPAKTASERWAPSDVPLTVPPALLSLLIQEAEKAQESSALFQ